MAKGTTVVFPATGATNTFDLSGIYVYGTGSDKATVTYGLL